jgi:hypothetical protein
MNLLEKKFKLQEDEIKMLKLEIDNIKKKLNENINNKKDSDGHLMNHR